WPRSSESQSGDSRISQRALWRSPTSPPSRVDPPATNPGSRGDAARSGAWFRKDSEYLTRVRYRALARQLGVDVARVASNHPVATGPLGHVERLVRGLDQSLAGVAITREDGDAQAQ